MTASCDFRVRRKTVSNNRKPSTEELRDDLLKDHWMWTYSWRGVSLAFLERGYEVPRAAILSIMRDIAHKHDPPDTENLPNSRCKSCGMRIVWGKQNGRAHPLDPKILNVLTAEGKLVRGRESHFVSCPNAKEHRSNQ